MSAEHNDANLSIVFLSVTWKIKPDNKKRDKQKEFANNRSHTIFFKWLIVKDETAMDASLSH